MDRFDTGVCLERHDDGWVSTSHLDEVLTHLLECGS